MIRSDGAATRPARTVVRIALPVAMALLAGRPVDAAARPVAALPCSIDTPADWAWREAGGGAEISAPGAAVSMSIVGSPFGVFESRKQWLMRMAGVTELESTSARWWVETGPVQTGGAERIRQVAIVGKTGQACQLDVVFEPSAREAVAAAIRTLESR